MPGAFFFVTKKAFENSAGGTATSATRGGNTPWRARLPAHYLNSTVKAASASLGFEFKDPLEGPEPQPPKGQGLSGPMPSRR
jgi:hypothetical protein